MQAPSPAAHGRRARPPALILTVAAFGLFVAADDLLVVSTMLRPMVDDLGLVLPDDLDDTAWIVNVYLIAYLSVMPVAGRLSDVFGRRAVFVGALALFLAGSVVVPAAGSLGVLLVGRAMTAAGGGALVPIALAVAGDLYDGPRRVRAIGLLGAVETIGWVWGPLYGALLVRYLSWQWQFHLNVPLAVVGMAAGWAVLDPTRRGSRRIGWTGAGSLTVALVSLGVALLAEARVQSVTGLGELAGGSDDGPGLRWLYGVAVLAIVALVVVERRSPAPVLDRSVVAGRAPVSALVVNGLLGVGLVVALVNVPLFVNVVEADAGRAAVEAGALLTALTATMAATSYLGGVVAGRVGAAPPALVGVVGAAIALAAMGATWTVSTTAPTMALHLGLLGAALGLVLTPTTALVVDTAGPAHRGTAAALVIVVRLIGFSVGLAALTAWGLHRYDQLRADLELPALGSPGFEGALAEAAAEVSTTALAETFLGAAAALALGAVVGLGLFSPGRRDRRRRRSRPRPGPRRARSS